MLSYDPCGKHTVIIYLKGCLPDSEGAFVVGSEQWEIPIFKW